MAPATDAYADDLRALYDEAQRLIDDPAEHLDAGLAEQSGASIYERYAGLRHRIAAELETQLPAWTPPPPPAGPGASLERDDLRLLQQSIFEVHEILDQRSG